MNLRGLIASRLGRDWSLSSLGPNEARLLFDAAMAVGALIASALFLQFFETGPHRLEDLAWLLVLPPVFLLLNGVAGVYTRLKRSASRIKGLVLASTLAVSGLLAWAMGAPAAGAALWGLLVVGPVVMARVLLGLPFSKHASLVTTLVVNRRGPVVVLGGAGYIGCHTIDLLLQQGYHVRVLDRLMYGREPIAEFLRHPNFEIIEGDVTDITRVTSVMRNASAVIHFAGLVGDPACAVDIDFTRHTNIVATRMAKDVAQSLGVYRFIFASSCSVYGVSDDEVNELSELHPVSLYAQTKIDSEKELLFVGRDDFFVTVLRFATVFGHSRRPRFDLVANLFTAQAMTEGLITVVGPDQWRPFVHVRDLARAVVAVLEAKPELIQGQIFNVGNPRLNLTIGQLAETVERVAGEFRSGVTRSVRPQNIEDRRNYAVSFNKIRRHLSFEPTMDLDDGIREMARHFIDGTYHHYREEAYSNLATTRRALEYFHDPLEAQRLYGPLKAG
jgi:nucleoside-diphosphate-sugar epimerase